MPANPSTARNSQALVYDPETERTILFGGGKDRFSFTDEAWIYQVKPNRWVQILKP